MVKGLGGKILDDDGRPVPITLVVQNDDDDRPRGDFLTRDEAIELVEKGRTEEKNKLYPEIEELRGTVKTLEQEREARLAAEAQAEEARQQEEERVRQENLSVKDLLQEQSQRFEAQIQTLNAERARDAALLAKEREFGQLRDHIANRLDESQDEIEPRFARLLQDGTIRVNSVDEVDRVIDQLKAQSAELGEEFRSRLENAGVLPNGTRPAPPRMPMTGSPALDADPIAGTLDKDTELTAEQIAAIPMSDYSKPEVRAALMGASSRFVNQHGAYGQRR